MISKLFPYRRLFLHSSLSAEEIQKILSAATERADKRNIDLSKIDSFEGIIYSNSFVISRGPSSLTLGKMSSIPIFIGDVSNINGGSNIKVIVRLNYLGGAIVISGILLVVIAFKVTYLKFGLGQSVPNLLLIAVVYVSIINEFNKSIDAFLAMLSKKAIIK
jgi:hypothetical protein